MEKISGIIPTSSRVSSVDLKESAPVRPGTPLFGRKEGGSTQRTPLPLETTAQRAVGLQNEMLDWRSKEDRNAGIARELSEKFFLSNKTSAEPENSSDEIAIEKMLMALDSPAKLAAPAPAESSEEAIAPEEPALMPKGSYIDYQA